MQPQPAQPVHCNSMLWLVAGTVAQEVVQRTVAVTSDLHCTTFWAIELQSASHSSVCSALPQLANQQTHHPETCRQSCIVATPPR